MNDIIAYGETTIANLTEPFSVILTSESQQFSTDANLKVTSTQSYYTDVLVYHGSTQRTDFTIGSIQSTNGITVSKSGNRITFQVDAETTIASNTGSFTIPVVLDGETVNKIFSWSCARQGEPGTEGHPALNIILGKETQNIPCDSKGIVSDGMLIHIPFYGYSGFDKVDCSVSIGVLPNGMTLGQNSAATPEQDGLIILNVAKGANLNDASIKSNDISLTFTICEHTIIKQFSWSKTKNGADGTLVLYELDCSSPVINKNSDDTFSPDSITFNSYYRNNQSVEKLPYDGIFVITESTDGATYTNKYVSSQNENTVTYIPSSSDVIRIKCTLCEADNLTKLLDIRTISVLNDKYISDTITQIQKEMSGVSMKVDANEKFITQEAWKESTIEVIDENGNVISKELKDWIASHTVDLDGITSIVNDNKERITEMVQTADGWEFIASVTGLYDDALNADSDKNEEARNKTIITLDINGITVENAKQVGGAKIVIDENGLRGYAKSSLGFEDEKVFEAGRQMYGNRATLDNGVDFSGAIKIIPQTHNHVKSGVSTTIRSIQFVKSGGII